jgi:hypothetical protein
MSPVTHFLAGWMVAQFADQDPPRGLVLVVLAGVAPDLDGLGIVRSCLPEIQGIPYFGFPSTTTCLGITWAFVWSLRPRHIG